MTDIRKSSKSPDVNIIKMGHTTNQSFGSSPTKNAKRPATTDVSIPTAKG